MTTTSLVSEVPSRQLEYRRTYVSTPYSNRYGGMYYSLLSRQPWPVTFSLGPRSLSAMTLKFHRVTRVVLACYALCIVHCGIVQPPIDRHYPSLELRRVVVIVAHTTNEHRSGETARANGLFFVCVHGHILCRDSRDYERLCSA